MDGAVPETFWIPTVSAPLFLSWEKQGTGGTGLFVCFFFSLLIRVIEILGTRLLDIVAFIKCDPCDQVDTLQTSVQVE